MVPFLMIFLGDFLMTIYKNLGSTKYEAFRKLLTIFFCTFSFCACKKASASLDNTTVNFALPIAKILVSCLKGTKKPAMFQTSFAFFGVLYNNSLTIRPAITIL